MISYRNRILILVSAIFIATIITVRANSVNEKEVKILMPAPFADSTKELIDTFNNANNGHIKIKVTRGPLETESVSDLAISNLLLGKSNPITIRRSMFMLILSTPTIINFSIPFT